MAYFPYPAPGQQPMSSSLGVVVASDQSPVAIKSSIAGGIFPVSGSVAAVITGTPNVNTAGSVAAWLQSSNASVITVGTAAANQSVSGTVNTLPLGTIVTSLVSTIPSSVLVGASIFGTVPVTQVTNPWTVVSSIAGGLFPISGSVAAVVTNTNVNVSGSVVAFQAGTQAPSVYGVRNDAVASFLGANLTVRPIAVDSAGRTLLKPFAAEESRVEGYITLTSQSVTTLVAAAGAGLRNYITDAWFANSGSVTTLVTFVSQGGASVLGYTIAPAGGGSNLIGLQTPIRTGANETFDIQATGFTSILYGTVKGYKAP